MSRVMYFDCFAGAAGDMVLGALLDAGLPLDGVREALGSLGVGHQLAVEKVLRAGISGTHVRVLGEDAPHTHGHDHGHSHDHGPAGHHHHDHGHASSAPHQITKSPHPQIHRSLPDVVHLLGHSALSAAARARAVEMFRRLAEAEAAIHPMPVEQVHFHEVGAIDSIIDIAGAAFGMEWFGIDDVMASPMNVGSGTVEMAHGTFPVPAPATVRLLAGVPMYSSGVQAELVTPTGALLISTYARQYGPVPPMTVERVGYGAGTRDLSPLPNVLRVLIGSRVVTHAGDRAGEVVKIECEIDDMNPQIFGPVSERLLAAGALDVFLTAIQMKKGRPGTLLTLVAPAERREALTSLLFRETTTIGVRFERVFRETLDRRWVEVKVEGGFVRIKVAGREGETLNVAPEFEDCLRVATATGRPLKAVQADALRAWFERDEA